MTLAYVVGFAVLMATLGWQPTPERGQQPAAGVPAAVAPALSAPAAPASAGNSAGDSERSQLPGY